MIKKIRKFYTILKTYFKNNIVRGGTIFFISGLLANFMSYFYRIAMGRMLGPATFGELIAIISMFLILSTLAAPFQEVGARYAAVYQARNSLSNIGEFFLNFSFAGILVGTILLKFGMIFKQFFIRFLNLSSLSNFYFLLMIVFTFFIVSVGWGILHGLQRFLQLGVSQLVDSFGKLIFGAVFVLLGFKLTGALAGILVSMFLSYAVVLYFCRDVVGGEKNKIREETKVKNREVIKYMVFSFLTLLLLNIFLNIDVVLAKRYFSEHETGIYSGVATLGQATFIMGQLLGGIIFPIAVYQKEKKGDYITPFKTIMGIGILLLVLTCLVFFLFPGFLIKLFLGPRYLEGAPFLGYYGAIMGTLGLLWSLTAFEKGLNRFYFLPFLVLGGILETFLMVTRNSNFSQFLIALSVGIGTAILGTILTIFIAERAKKKKELSGNL